MCKLYLNSNGVPFDGHSVEVFRRIQPGQEDGLGIFQRGFIYRSLRMEMQHAKNYPFCEPLTISNGDPHEGWYALHVRTATTDKGLLNCHPMQHGKSLLMHNGVVDGKHPRAYVPTTTCDSELLLSHLIHGADFSSLEGYAAIIAWHRRKLWVARCSRAPLFYGERNGIKEFCSVALSSDFYPVKENTLFIINEQFEIIEERAFRLHRPIRYGVLDSADLAFRDKGSKGISSSLKAIGSAADRFAPAIRH